MLIPVLFQIADDSATKYYLQPRWVGCCGAPGSVLKALMANPITGGVCVDKTQGYWIKTLSPLQAQPSGYYDVKRADHEEHVCYHIFKKKKRREGLARLNIISFPV